MAQVASDFLEHLQGALSGGEIIINDHHVHNPRIAAGPAIAPAFNCELYFHRGNMRPRSKSWNQGCGEA
jgi:hypothetical protein